MWDYDSLIGKAGTYFRRAADHPDMEDDEFALWILLGLEFLLRAPLAKIHPSLLAAPDGDAILHANGIPTASDPRSVPIHTVLSRLKQIVPDFNDDRAKDANFLNNLRNAEIHTGKAALASIQTTTWLPRFVRVADAICANLGMRTEDLITDQVGVQARALVDAEDAKAKQAVARAINEARRLFSYLTAPEVEQRAPTLPVRGDWDEWEPARCPACETTVPMRTTHLRTGADRIDGDEIRTDNVWVAKELHCPVCALHLEGTAEIHAAGLEQQYVRTVVQTLEERYFDAHEYIDTDYGND